MSIELYKRTYMWLLNEEHVKEFTVVVEFDDVERFSARLLTDVTMHEVGSVLVQRQCVRERLRRRLQTERNVGVAEEMSERTKRTTNKCTRGVMLENTHR